jgi:hypothetical protein
MNLVTILVLSLFAQCNAYQLPTLRRLGLPSSSIFAINHQTPSLPGWLTRLAVNNPLCHSHSPRRLFSTADDNCGHDLALPSLDFTSNQTSLDHFNKVDYFGRNKRRLESFDENNMACAGIPEEIINNQYGSERELLMDLEKLGLDDL